MYVQWLQMPDIKSDRQVILVDTEQLVNEAHRTVHEISFNMSPHVLKNFGLIPALEAYTTKLSDVSPVEFYFDIKGVNERFAEDMEIILYRVLSECINNSVKYANATEIQILIHKEDDNLSVICSDNGKGFNPDNVVNEKKGLGLFNMQNRIRALNGKLEINSEPGRGTQVVILLKLI